MGRASWAVQSEDNKLSVRWHSLLCSLTVAPRDHHASVSCFFHFPALNCEPAQTLPPLSRFCGVVLSQQQRKKPRQDFYCEILFSSFSQQQACETLVYNFSSSENIHCWYRKKDKLTPCWFISTVERSQNWILWKNKLKPCFIQIIIQSIILLVEDVISDFIHDLYLKD